MGVTARPADDRDHAAHDEIHVVAYACGDLAGRDAAAVAALVGRCPDCARLAADVATIRAEIAGLPAPARTRDFRLRPADLAGDGGRGPRGLLRRFAAPRLAFAAPLGSALAALGLAGLLIGTPLAGTGDGAAPLAGGPAAAPEAAPYGASAPVESMSVTADDAGGATNVAGGAPDAAAATPDTAAATKDAAAAATKDAAAAATKDAAAAGAAERSVALDSPVTPASSGPAPLAAISVALLVAGLGLLLLRLAAVRLAMRRPARPGG